VWRPGRQSAVVGSVPVTASTVSSKFPSTAASAIGIASGLHGGVSTYTSAAAMDWTGSAPLLLLNRVSLIVALTTSGWPAITLPGGTAATFRASGPAGSMYGARVTRVA